jgi:uncharacterized delta-60 repeat protein
MYRKTIYRLKMAFPLVLLCIGLADCGGKTTATVVSPPPTAISVKRYTALGQLDTVNFGGGSGSVATKIDPSEFEYALAVALQTDGKIIAAGHSVLAGQGVIALVRYNANGTLDSAAGSFGSGGIIRTAVGSDSAEAAAVAVQADGKIVVAGTIFASDSSSKGIALLRYNGDGTLDTSFGAQHTGIVTATVGTGSDTAAAALALQADTKIVVAGHAFTGAKTDIVLLRYNADGTLDSAPGSFGTGGVVITPLASDAAALAIQLQPADSKIVAAGSVGNFGNSPMDSALLRYNTDGTLDTTFGSAGNGIVITDIASGNNFSNAIALQPADGKIVVAGHANVNFSADTSDVALLRYNPNGTLDTATFGAQGIVVTDLGGFDNAFSIALQATGEIVVSGNTGSAGSVTRVTVLRYGAGGTLDPAFGTGGIVTTSATGPSTIASGNAVLMQSGGIVVAGYD